MDYLSHSIGGSPGRNWIPTPRPRARTLWLFVLGIGFFLSGGAVSIYSTIALLQTRDDADHSREVLGEVAGLSAAVNDVASSSRGYALTGRGSLVEDFNLGESSLYLHLQRLTLLTANDAEQQARLTILRKLVNREIDGASSLVEARRERGLTQAVAVSLSNVEAATIDKIRLELNATAAEEDSILKARRHEVRLATFEALAVEVVLGLLSALIIALVIWRMLSERRALAVAQESSLMAQEELAATMIAVEGRTADLTILSELSAVLGMCLTIEEFHAAVARTMTRALPGCSGAIGVINNSRSLIEVPVRWGDPVPEIAPYGADSCCALRSGKVFRGGALARGIDCRHGSTEGAGHSLCVPLSAQGDTIGVLHTWSADGVRLERSEALIISIGEHLAMALANLTAREALRHQATRDPLTGAFNRRFMLEVLDRELLRARRPNRPVGVLMIDVDHFKQFNDTYGHQAGDDVLQVVVQHIRSSVRAEDYVCRYGGEEFAVILPEASAAVAAARAEEIRLLVETACRRREGGAVTVSIGVAVYPDHAGDAQDLLKRADEALYRAKRAGRNCSRTTTLTAEAAA